MKIAVSSTGNKKESILDRRFGRCDYFAIFDTESGDFKAIENKGVSSSQGAGIAAATQIIEEKVSAIITGNLGPNAFELIEKAGIEAYNCESVEVSNAVEQLKKKELSKICMAGNAHQGLK